MRQKSTKIIFTLLLFSIASCLGCQQAFAQQIELTDIHTDPTQVHVGDSFQVNATIVNNSTDTILFNGGCQSPLSTSFDKNVILGQAMGCFALFNQILLPGHNATVISPGSGNSYTAASSGDTNANLTFVYHFSNNTQSRISKNFTFAISAAPVPEFPYAMGYTLVLAAVSAILIMNLTRSCLFKL